MLRSRKRRVDHYKSEHLAAGAHGSFLIAFDVVIVVIAHRCFLVGGGDPAARLIRCFEPAEGLVTSETSESLSMKGMSPRCDLHDFLLCFTG